VQATDEQLAADTAARILRRATRMLEIEVLLVEVVRRVLPIEDREFDVAVELSSVDEEEEEREEDGAEESDDEARVR